MDGNKNMFKRIKEYIKEFREDRSLMMPTKFHLRLCELGFVKIQPFIWQLVYCEDGVSGFGDPITEEKLCEMNPKDFYNYVIDQKIKILQANKL